MPTHSTTVTRPPELDPEFRLLLACARTALRPADAGRIVSQYQESLDWLAFLRLVVRHRVAPLVWQTLKDVDNGSIPPAIEAELRRRVEKNTLEALQQAAELVRLVRHFAHSGIRVLPLKGPVLAMQAFGDLNLRHAGDLDLLVDPASVQDADRILTDAGYVRASPDYELSSGQMAAFMKIRKDFSYSRPDSRVRVELHWRWSQNAHLLPLDLDKIWAGHDVVRLGGESIPALPQPELLLYLCAHGAHTGWFRLKWLCDIAELAQEGGRVDLSAAIARAQDLGVERMLGQGLLLAHQMLGAPLPFAPGSDIRQDRTVPSLVDTATQALLQDERYWSTDDTPVSFMPKQARYRLKLRRSLRYKWHNVYFYSLWTDDSRPIRLPDRLAFLYFVLAPLTWVRSLLGRPSGGATGKTEQGPPP